MDDITTRTVIIAVNIFVTITIVSLVIVMFFQMKDIYKIVLQTDTSIYDKFDDVFSMYHGKTETGIGLLNALKRYEDGTEDVIIKYPKSEQIREYIDNNNLREATYLKGLMEDNKSFEGEKFKYEDKYNVTVEILENSQAQIVFEKVN